jgi:hypothetical protein
MTYFVVNDERLTDVTEYCGPADDRLMREVTIAQTLSAPVNFIAHTLTDVNKQLERGRPFFVDILREGALYEAEDFPFASPKTSRLTKREGKPESIRSPVRQRERVL